MFLPENIDLGQPEKYILSIRIKSNRFMFSIYEPRVGRSYCLRETNFSADTSLLNNVQRIVFDLNFLTQQFLKTNVIFVSSDYSIVPNKYLDNKDKCKLYDLTQTRKSEHLLSCQNDALCCTTLFDIGADMYSFLSRSLYNPHFYHHSHLLVSFFEEKSRNIGAVSKMFAYFHDDVLDIICFNESRLMHCLSYENESPANHAYYILKLWEKCGFDQQSDKLYLAGSPEQTTINTLQEYIKNTESISMPTEILLWSEDAQNAPIDLIALSL